MTFYSFDGWIFLFPCKMNCRMNCILIKKKKSLKPHQIPARWCCMEKRVFFKKYSSQKNVFFYGFIKCQEKRIFQDYIFFFNLYFYLFFVALFFVVKKAVNNFTSLLITKHPTIQILASNFLVSSEHLSNFFYSLNFWRTLKVVYFPLQFFLNPLKLHFCIQWTKFSSLIFFFQWLILIIFWWANLKLNSSLDFFFLWWEREKKLPFLSEDYVNYFIASWGEFLCGKGGKMFLSSRGVFTAFLFPKKKLEVVFWTSTSPYLKERKWWRG